MTGPKKTGKKAGEKSCCRPAAGGESCCGSESGKAEAMKAAVRKSYGERIKASGKGTCCGTQRDVAGLAGYTPEQLGGVPEEMRETTFACGNPVAFSQIRAGEVVLDIGSGAGLDAFLAAKKVGPKGKVIGLDMTPEMIAAARANARRAGVTNVEFRLGEAEAMPVEDASCDWIISNCVINLAPDKGKVFREAFRALKPGGRLMVSDMVTHDLPPEVRADTAAWTGCIGGALEEEEYLGKIREAGFQRVEIVGKMTYDQSALESLARGCCSPEQAPEVIPPLVALLPRIAGRVSSIRVSAVKPARE